LDLNMPSQWNWIFRDIKGGWMFKYIPSIILTTITGKMFWNATELELRLC
jgi:hypothetical protein